MEPPVLPPDKAGPATHHPPASSLPVVPPTLNTNATVPRPIRVIHPAPTAPSAHFDLDLPSPLRSHGPSTTRPHYLAVDTPSDAGSGVRRVHSELDMGHSNSLPAHLQHQQHHHQRFARPNSLSALTASPYARAAPPPPDFGVFAEKLRVCALSFWAWIVLMYGYTSFCVDRSCNTKCLV
jgi:hypothetical protein